MKNSDQSKKLLLTGLVISFALIIAGFDFLAIVTWAGFLIMSWRASFMEGSPVKEGGIDGETMNATAAAKEGGLEQGPTNQEPARFFCKIGKYDNKDLFRFVIMGGRGYEFHGKAPANFEQTPEGFAIFGDIMYSPVVDKDEFVLELNKAEGEDGACNAG